MSFTPTLSIVAGVAEALQIINIKCSTSTINAHNMVNNFSISKNITSEALFAERLLF
ncbi:MAG: hypothetical protein R3Y49_03005 [Rikenellaceae bacterium]